MQKMNDNDTQKVTGGGSFWPWLTAEAFGGKYEEPKGKITRSSNIDDVIPRPRSKTESINYNGKTWTPALVHCGWHQEEVIWKSSDGDYLLPTGIDIHGM